MVAVELVWIKTQDTDCFKQLVLDQLVIHILVTNLN